MIHQIQSLLGAAHQALGLLLDGAVSINLWWIAAGVVLYELAQVLRTRGWFNILRAAYPNASSLRARDVAGAYLAGAGLNAVLPARSGDVLKLFIVHRKLPSSRYSTLAATFLPETLFDSFCGAALVIWALAHGFLPVPLGPGDLPGVDVSFVMVHPIISAAAALTAGLGGLLLVRWLHSRARHLLARFRRGFAILGSPRGFLLGVASWQALARLIRLAGLACFMAAMGLPITLDTATLAMAAQGAGWIVPIAPASAGIRVALLSYGFVEITHSPVDIASITGFWLILGATQLIANVTIGVAAIYLTFGTTSPKRALAIARQAANTRAALRGTGKPATISEPGQLA
ncbi:MAG: lysylphosphatidylglycerol synthase transmembrane domain-containing protein [Solirubrobacteraceae bacterium]